MANIKDKDINDLSSWNLKELRKLKIMSKNRISALETSSNKDVSDSHPLKGRGIEEIQELILNIQRAEKALTK